MEWWTHLWLNEGFATWIEYLSVDHTHPEFEIWTNFLSREYASAMSLDSLANSHPIEVMTTTGGKFLCSFFEPLGAPTCNSFSPLSTLDITHVMKNTRLSLPSRFQCVHSGVQEP